MADINGFLSRLKGVRKNTDDHWMAFCPVHEKDGGHVQSLSVSHKSGKILLKCHAGCKTDDIRTELGLTWADLGSGNGSHPVQAKAKPSVIKATATELAVSKGFKPEVFARYGIRDHPRGVAFPYYDAGGKHIGSKIRVRLDKPESFWEKPDGGSIGIYCINLLDKLRPSRKLIIVEGETDTITLLENGFPAIGLPGNTSWKLLQSDHLHGFDVVYIIEEHDHARGGPQTVALGKAHLKELNYLGEVRIVKMRQANVKDPNDLFRADPRLFRGRFLSLLKQSEPIQLDPFKIQLVTDSELRQMALPPIRPVIPHLLMEGTTILAGRPKCGKSFMALQMAQALATGGRALGYFPIEKPMNVVYFALEDGMGRLQGRLKSLDQSLGEIQTTDNIQYSFDLPPVAGKDPAQFADAILGPYITDNPDIGMIVIDTLARLMPVPGDKKRNENAYQADYNLVKPFQALSKAHHIAIVLVHHTRKALGEDPIDEVSGTLGLTGGVDSVIIIKRPKRRKIGDLVIASRDLPGGEFAVEFADCLWSVLGESEAYHISEERKSVMEYLAEKGSRGATVAQVASDLGEPKASMRSKLRRMALDGQLERRGESYFYTNAKVRFESHAAACSLRAAGEFCGECVRLFSYVDAGGRNMEDFLKQT